VCGVMIGLFGVFQGGSKSLFGSFFGITFPFIFACVAKISFIILFGLFLFFIVCITHFVNTHFATCHIFPVTIPIAISGIASAQNKSASHFGFCLA